MSQCLKCHPRGDDIRCRCIDGCHCPEKLDTPMPAIKPITIRGFEIFSREKISCRWGTLRVQESSLAFEGAHVWLYYDENEGVNSTKPTPLINVSNAKKLIAALQKFIMAAEAGQLTEPASLQVTKGDF